MKIKYLATLISAAIALSCYGSSSEPVSLPRPEYPRPQFERKDWTNLNGEWSYTFDFGKSGKEHGYSESTGFQNSIIVPFCPESTLSGVGHTDFINAMWYHRNLSIPEDWDGKKVLLNFGGVDYRAEVFINGKSLFTHYGGGASFAVDLTDAIKYGENNDLVVYVEDDVKSWQQPLGKQSRRLNAYECFYTRVTGIWQTVWLEAVDQYALKQCRITPDLDGNQFVFEPKFYNVDGSSKFNIKIKDGNKVVCEKTTPASNSSFITAEIKKAKTWSPEDPFLYDIEFSVINKNGETIDKVNSYAGMRKSELRNGVFYLNNKPYYQRLVLDQGYYPDGQ